MNMTKSGKILTVGRIYCDLIFSGFPNMPVLGEEVYADEFEVHAGGGAFITAAHLVACGKETALCAVLPGAPFSALVQDEINASSIDLGPSLIAPTGWGNQTTIAMAHSDDRAFLTKRGGAAIPQTCKAEIDSGVYAHLHIAELATLLECPEILDWAEQTGLSVSLDCSWDVEAMRHPDAIQLISKVDIFLPNLAELKYVMQADHIDPTLVSKTFGDGCSVAVKRGAQGASLIVGGTQIDAPSIQSDVVDTTGAGDAFNAGFIATWLDGAREFDCLKAGNQRASTAVGKIGGAPEQVCAVGDDANRLNGVTPNTTQLNGS